MAAWASDGTVFQSGAGIERGGPIPSTTKPLYREFGLGLAPVARKSPTASDEALNSYLFRGGRAAFRQLLGRRARATEVGTTGLIAVHYILDTDMVIFMLRGLKAPARQRARRDKALALVA